MKRQTINKVFLILICVLVMATQTGCKRRGGDDNVTAPPDRAPAESSRIMDTSNVEGITHVVSQGETLWKLKEIYGISIPALKKYNDVSENRALKKGEKIFIPGSATVLNARRETFLKKNRKADEKKPAAAKKFDWPVSGKVLSKFSPSSKGIFIKVPSGTAVKSINAGEVVYSGQMKGYGKLIILDHLDGMFSIYGYNSKVLVKKGDTVKAGQKVAVGGETSPEGVNRVYFELRSLNQEKGEPESVDPLKYLKAEGVK